MDDGSSISRKDTQSSKAFFPIVASCSGRVTSLKDVHSRKATASIVLRLIGKSTLRKAVHRWNVPNLITDS